jgi:hypothetical protein
MFDNQLSAQGIGIGNYKLNHDKLRHEEFCQTNLSSQVTNKEELWLNAMCILSKLPV